jgi:hypothetical protein
MRSPRVALIILLLSLVAAPVLARKPNPKGATFCELGSGYWTVTIVSGISGEEMSVVISEFLAKEELITYYTFMGLCNNRTPRELWVQGLNEASAKKVYNFLRRRYPDREVYNIRP